LCLLRNFLLNGSGDAHVLTVMMVAMLMVTMINPQAPTAD